MKGLTAEQRFLLARGELTQAVLVQCQTIRDKGRTIGSTGWEARPGLAQPGSVKELAAMWDLEVRRGRPVPVLADHSDRTVYLFPEANHAFRFWHDYTHIQNGRGFDLISELEVARSHVNSLGQMSEDAKLLLWIDTALQAQRFYFFGGHVADQLGWAQEQFTRLTSP